jgi:hypothetical protein
VATATVVELLALTGVVPASPWLTHEVALPPLDLTADLGVLLGRASSPWWFGTGLVLAVCGRALILTVMLGSRRWWGLALRFELMVLVPSFLAAELATAGQMILYSALFWAGMAVAVLCLVVFAHLPWRTPPRLGRATLAGLARGVRAPTVVAYLLALTVLDAFVRAGGDDAALAGVVVSAILTLLVARRLSRPGVPALPARLGTAAVAAVVAVVVVVFVVVAPAPHAPAAHPASRNGELVLVAGMDTSTGYGAIFGVDPRTLGFRCSQTVYFSYRGPGPGAPRGRASCPVRSGAPYGRSDTERPLPVLVAAMRAQIDSLRPPVTIVAHSSGAWVAWAAVAGDPSTPVRRLVLVAPLADPHGYPPPGTDGPGVVGAAGMRFVSWVGRAIGFSHTDPDRPLPAELIGSAGAADALLARRLPGRVRALAVPSAEDLALFGAGRPFPHAELACPVAQSHGRLPGSTAVARAIDRFLSGRGVPSCHPWQTWASALSAGFRVP